MVTAIARDDGPTAFPMLERAVELLEEVGDQSETVEALVVLGNAHRFTGDKAGAKRLYLRAIDLAYGAGNRQLATGLLFILTALEGDTGRHERVATIWGAAAAAQEASGALKPPGAVRLIGDPVATARETMGDEAVERALAAGRMMDADAVIAYAHAD